MDGSEMSTVTTTFKEMPKWNKIKHSILKTAIYQYV